MSFIVKFIQLYSSAETVKKATVQIPKQTISVAREDGFKPYLVIEFSIVHATQMICWEIHKLFMIETSFYWKTFSVFECFILTDSNEIE